MKKSQRVAIAVFAYNRPIHLKNLLQSVISNPKSSDLEVYIIIDGLKNNENPQKNMHVLEEANKFQNIHKKTRVIKHEMNLGLSESVIRGVNKVFESNEKIIVLEDDLICSNYFLDFCLDGLSKFERIEQVASIHGYLPPLNIRFNEPSFLKGADCWGWATWKNRWESIEWDSEKLLTKLEEQKLISEFDLGDKFPFSEMLKQQANNEIDSWAIRWHASMFLQSRLTLYPNVSLIENVGFDNSGTHGKKTGSYNTQTSSQKISIPRSIKFEENNDFRNAMADFYGTLANQKEPLVYQLRKKLHSLLNFANKS